MAAAARAEEQIADAEVQVDYSIEDLPDEEEEDAVGNDDEHGGVAVGGDGGELPAAAGSSEKRDRVPSLQPPMAAFKVASISQECNYASCRMSLP